MMMCLVATTAQAQIKFCTSYADFKAGNWKPYSQLTPGKEPDSLRIQYDGTDFTLKTHDSEVNQIIKKDVLLMSIDGQLFINQHMLRDDDGNVLPVNHYLRALPYKGGDLCVVCYQVSLGDLLDLVNIGLDIALLATGHTTMGSIFLAIIACLPALANVMGVNNQFASFFGGTSLLIMVGVILDTLQQIESYLLMRHYDGLMKTGRLTGRSGM